MSAVRTSLDINRIDRATPGQREDLGMPDRTPRRKARRVELPETLDRLSAREVLREKTDLRVESPSGHLINMISAGPPRWSEELQCHVRCELAYSDFDRCVLTWYRRVNLDEDSGGHAPKPVGPAMDPRVITVPADVAWLRDKYQLAGITEVD